VLIVQKYGGSSLATFEQMENVAQRIIETKEGGNNVVVVLSARGDFTDELLKMAEQANPQGRKREVDALISVGEQISVALMAMILQRLGHYAVSLNAHQAGIRTCPHHTSARIRRIRYGRVLEELDKGNIVLVTGFQGVSPRDDVTTLGRGGSDTTAVALAASLNADVCEIYTDVDGVYSADPRFIPNAKKLPEITYYEMLELAALGAKVLQQRSVGLAKKYGVKLVVLSGSQKVSGTIVKEECSVEGIFVSGVVVNKDIALVTISGIKDVPGVWFKIFSAMSKSNIAIDFVYQRKERDGTKDISFTVEKERLADVNKVLSDNKHRLGFEDLSHDESLAKLSVVSTGMATNPGVPSVMLESLFEAGINVDNISTSEIKVSILLDKNDADRAAAIVHERFLDEGFIRT
jgi:aspartate kinase